MGTAVAVGDTFVEVGLRVAVAVGLTVAVAGTFVAVGFRVEVTVGLGATTVMQTPPLGVEVGSTGIEISGVPVWLREYPPPPTAGSPGLEETSPVRAKKMEQVVTNTSITDQTVFLTIATSTNKKFYACIGACFMPVTGLIP